MEMVKEEDGYCNNELDERLEHMYMWVTEININCMNLYRSLSEFTSV